MRHGAKNWSRPPVFAILIGIRFGKLRSASYWCGGRSSPGTFLVYRFLPSDRPPLPAALVGEHHRPHRPQCLVRYNLQRRLLLDCIPHIRIEPAIISALRLHLHARLAYQTQSSPQAFRFLSPIGAPVRPPRKVLSAQPRLLRVHSILHKRSLGSMNQKTRPRRKCDDPRPPPRPQASSRVGILQANVERI